MLRLLFVVLVCLSSLPLHAQTLIPAAEYARLPALSSPMISPDGLRLASTLIYKGNPLVLVQKLDVDSDQPREMNYPLIPGDFFVSGYRWVSNDRLIMSLRNTDAIRGILVNYNRLLSISRDGTDRILLESTPNNSGLYRLFPDIVSILEDDPQFIYATLDENPDEWLAPEVDKVNIYTGEKNRILRNNLKVFEWISDKKGEIRVGVRYKNEHGGNDVTIYYRDSNTDSWDVLQKIDYFEERRLIPQRFHDVDPNILLVSSQLQSSGEAGSENEETLYTYDLTRRKVTGRYVDTRSMEVEELVKRSLPGREVTIESVDKAKNRYVLRVYSDVFVPQYYLLDLSAGTLVMLSSEYPNLESAVLSPMEEVSYQSRDGLEIPAYLTIPADSEKENLPLVVYPHGGPWAHDEWGFDNYVQFFASRGYAVFQPQFRGSTGFGSAHEEAGYGQWGLKIQDDITDGVRWLIDQGFVDPKRIAIIGGSFGGYSAAMGIATTPDLYQCAVCINGVMDLEYFFDSGRNYYFESIMRETWNDRKSVENTSPYHLAEKVQAPVLLIAGEEDTVVSNKHSKKMYKRLQKLGKTSEYIELEDGEHWRTNEKNEIVVLEAIESFLSKYL